MEAIQLDRAVADDRVTATVVGHGRMMGAQIDMYQVESANAEMRLRQLWDTDDDDRDEGVSDGGAGEAVGSITDLAAWVEQANQVIR